MVERAFTESNSSRLQALVARFVARFENAIQIHDARPAASAAGLRLDRLASLVPAAYSGNIQEREIGRAAPAAENAALIFSSDFSTETNREVPAS